MTRGARKSSVNAPNPSHFRYLHYTIVSVPMAASTFPIVRKALHDADRRLAKRRTRHYEAPLLDPSTFDAFHKSLACIAVRQPDCQRSVRPLWRRLRILMFDVPCVLLFMIWNGTQFLVTFHDEYIAPQLNLLRWSDERAENESTYYHRICTVDDATATHPEELLVDSSMPTDAIVQSMSRNGTF